MSLNHGSSTPHKLPSTSPPTFHASTLGICLSNAIVLPTYWGPRAPDLRWRNGPSMHLTWDPWLTSPTHGRLFTSHMEIQCCCVARLIDQSITWRRCGLPWLRYDQSLVNTCPEDHHGRQAGQARSAPCRRQPSRKPPCDESPEGIQPSRHLILLKRHQDNASRAGTWVYLRTPHPFTFAQSLFGRRALVRLAACPEGQGGMARTSTRRYSE